MKRVMAVILSATTIFATFPVGVNASHGEIPEGNLATFFNQYSRYSGLVYACCKDIDNDDINEVIISEGNNNYSFYKKIDNSYKKIGSIYAQYGIYNADNGIIICFGGSGMIYYKNYYIKNNNLMEGDLIASYEGDGYSYNRYIVDGKNVSKNEYTNKENEILSNCLYFREYWISNNSSIKIILNGEELTFDQPPYIENGTTMVPMRAIFEALGASVDYDTETKAITATKGSTVIKLFANSDTGTVNGKEVTLTSPVANKNGTTMVPLRLVSEALGAEVSWDAETKIITIKNENTSSSTDNLKETTKTRALLISGYEEVKKNKEIFNNSVKYVKNGLENVEINDIKIASMDSKSSTTENYKWLDKLLESTFSDLKENDLSIIYYTGHSYYSYINEDGNFDGKFTYFGSFEEFYDLVKNRTKGNVLLIYDGCFAGELTKLKNIDDRIKIIASCEYDEEAVDAFISMINNKNFFEKLIGNKEKCSIFAYALNKGLDFENKNIDTNNDKNIDFNEMYLYLKNYVFNISDSISQQNLNVDFVQNVVAYPQNDNTVIFFGAN
ncbi:MAG: copper amine oxidase N-terminal domain-containing protein [Clostridia bacterium]|nr:copper amine oxidase N-terminal domain-containing protein [Clostridia bacterium]